MSQQVRLIMSKDVYTDNTSTYADYFANVGITGTRWLSFRDVPELVQKFVRGTTALDYGCGPGFSTLFLKSLGFEADGVDINKYMINYAKEKDPNGNYMEIESGCIPKMDHYYDFVFSSWVLPYISNREELQKIIKEIARVLKKKGTLIALVNSDHAFSYDWYSFRPDFEKNKKLFSGCVATGEMKGTGLTLRLYYWMEEDYRSLLENVGLNTIHIHRPLGKESDGYAWISESHINICNTFIARKDV